MCAFVCVIFYAYLSPFSFSFVDICLLSGQNGRPLQLDGQRRLLLHHCLPQFFFIIQWWESGGEGSNDGQRCPLLQGQYTVSVCSVDGPWGVWVGCGCLGHQQWSNGRLETHQLFGVAIGCTANPPRTQTLAALSRPSQRNLVYRHNFKNQISLHFLCCRVSRL